MTRKDTLREIREIKASEQDSLWIAEHYATLRRRYDRQFIAVYGRRVIDHGRDGEKLARRLRRDYPEVQPAITLTYVTLQEVGLILSA